MKYLNRILFLCVSILLASSCIEEQAYDDNTQKEGKPLTFSVSMADQDWYGVGVATRGGSQAVEEQIPTDMVTEEGKHVFITDHVVNGIDSKQTDLEKQEVITRAYVSKTIDTRKLSISQVGFTQGDGKNTYVDLMNLPAVTTNGVEWSCNEYFVNRKDYTAVRTFGALFPYSETYEVKTDDYEGTGSAFGTLQWLYRFRVGYELVSNSAAQQEDLLYAKQSRSFTAEQYAQNGATSLTFRHAMTAVKVKLGSTGFVPCVIKEVRLMNVHNKGTFHFFQRYSGQSSAQMLDSDGYWDVDDSMVNCFAVTDFDTQGEYNCYVTGDAATFMMIPQELPAEATLELDIVFANDYEGNVVTITAPIGRHSADGQPKYWEIGTTHEYIINTKENSSGYYMVVDGVDKNERAKYVDSEGGDASITLKSYRIDKESSGEYAPLPWQYIGWSLDGEDWNDDVPDWLHMTLSGKTDELEPGTYGNGSIEGEVINIHVDAMKAENGVSHAEILKSRPAKGGVSDGAYDLSRHEWGTGKSIGTTTANCYVIDAPGHYTFPTVYGNSMKNGEANPQAYGLQSTDFSNAPQGTSFVDYLDRQIMSPLIQYNTKLSRAALIWEDVDGMVKDVKLTQRGDYVEFNINREKIDQGNAVIAVFDEQDLIVWSWHIWVTDEDISATVPTGYGNYKAMPVNLGWKSTSKAHTVRGRDIYLLFAQGENDDEMIDYQTEIRITQRSNYLEDEGKNHKGSSPYYQWGRKDPLLGAVNGKSIPVNTKESRSFYCESLTTWAVPEWLDIVNKTVIAAAALAAGVAVGVLTCGIGAIVAGGIVVTTLGSTSYVVATQVDQACFTTTDTWGATIGYAIQHPTCDIKSAMTWTDSKTHSPYHDLWGIGQNTDDSGKKVKKTIYDPCPVGFHIPEGDAFSSLKNTAFNDGLSRGNLYLPACGARIDYIHSESMNGGFDKPLVDVGKACAYWTAAPCDEDANDNQHDDESFRSSEGAFALIAGTGEKGQGQMRGSYEAWGYNVRPIQDF